MKLDKIKFAKVVSWISRTNGLEFAEDDLRELDNIIDIEAPEVAKASQNDVDELLRCMLTASDSGFISAIKAYRVLTGASLKESKEAIEKYRKSKVDWDEAPGKLKDIINYNSVDNQ